MHSQLRHLGRNLLSGARLVFGQPVTRLDFRIGVPQLLMLFVVSALLDIAVEGLRQAPGRCSRSRVSPARDSMAAVLMLFAALLALAFRQPDYALTLPVLVLSGEWPLQLVRMGVSLAVGEDVALFGSAIRAEQVLECGRCSGCGARRRSVSRRGVRTSGRDRWPPRRSSRARCGSALSCSPTRGGGRSPGRRSRATRATRARRRRRCWSSSRSCSTTRSTISRTSGRGITDLYFVGFAPYAAEDVFRKDMEVARDLFDDRFDTDGRSVVLVNNPRTVLEQPLATVSNLRATLSELGDTIDPEHDVVMVYLTATAAAITG